MRPGEGALAAGGGDHRGPERLRQLSQLAGRVRPYDSPARDDRRPGRVRQQVGRHRSEFGTRRQLLGEGVAARHHGDQGRGQQHVLRDLHPHRAVRGGQRRLPGRLDRGGDLGLGADGVHRLHHAPERGRLVREFVQIAVTAAAQTGGRDLAADRQDRRRGRGRLLESGQGRQRAGAGRQQQRRRLPRDPAVRVRREARVVLHPQADVAQIGPPQRVEHAERVLAGQAEDGRRAERGQRLHDQVSAAAAGRRVQRGLGLGGGRAEHQVVVVSHCARASAIWRDMIVVSS